MKNLFDSTVRFLAMVGSIANALTAYYVWGIAGQGWAWFYLILGCLAVVVCMENPKKEIVKKYKLPIFR